MQLFCNLNSLSLVWIISGRGNIYRSCKRSEGGNWGKFGVVGYIPLVNLLLQFVICWWLRNLMFDIGQEIDMGNWKNQALGWGSNSRKCVYRYIAGAGAVLDSIFISQKFGEVMLLFRSLDHLVYQLLQTLMVCNSYQWQ